MKIGCIGLGLIGGSFALSMKRNFSDFQVFGMDTNPEHLQKGPNLEYHRPSFGRVRMV